MITIHPNQLKLKALIISLTNVFKQDELLLYINSNLSNTDNKLTPTDISRIKLDSSNVDIPAVNEALKILTKLADSNNIKIKTEIIKVEYEISKMQFIETIEDLLICIQTNLINLKHSITWVIDDEFIKDTPSELSSIANNLWITFTYLRISGIEINVIYQPSVKKDKNIGSKHYLRMLYAIGSNVIELDYEEKKNESINLVAGFYFDIENKEKCCYIKTVGRIKFIKYDNKHKDHITKNFYFIQSILDKNPNKDFRPTIDKCEFKVLEKYLKRVELYKDESKISFELDTIDKNKNSLLDLKIHPHQKIIRLDKLYQLEHLKKILEKLNLSDSIGKVLCIKCREDKMLLVCPPIVEVTGNNLCVVDGHTRFFNFYLGNINSLSYVKVHNPPLNIIGGIANCDISWDDLEFSKQKEHDSLNRKNARIYDKYIHPKDEIKTWYADKFGDSLTTNKTISSTQRKNVKK